MKKYLYFIPALIMMIVIFSFSQQNGVQSTGISYQIHFWLLNHLHIWISEFIIRKAAHMSEYALLSLTFLYAFYHFDLSVRKYYLFSFICTFIYACSDEFHQFFINGRSAQITDIFIDSTGAIIILTIFYIIQKKLFSSSKE